ncbi:hypothetical protein S7S_09340 [Isoalcanivorax pacificus W11-5]|uniref:Uncharacterized protein n=1 Tax=Isoalcanivorax pacificus W11-5 TaxID=391936 RepID=A0A0B4XNE1_9GAMM|nr:hypothetical protein [Isoalcanivorax pacificus]AJD48280.1 hypothetical protein S7S_09340 [Isoalcanivorax pacificus W11-5]
MPAIVVPAAADLVALNAVAGQAGLPVEYNGSVRNAIEAVAAAGGVSLNYSGSDRNAIEVLARLLGEKNIVCAWPLSADQNEISVVAPGAIRPTLENNDMTIVHTLKSQLVEWEQYYAMSAGMATGEAPFADLSDGVVAMQISFDELPQVSSNAGVLTGIALLGGGGEVLAVQVSISAEYESGYQLIVGGMDSEPPQQIELSGRPFAMGISLDNAAKTATVKIDGQQIAVVSWGGGNSAQPIMIINEFSGVSSEHAGQIYRITLNTDAAHIDAANVLPGALDFCGNTI